MIHQTLADSLRTFMLMNRSRRESVITHNAVLSTGYVGFCGVRLLVWPGELLQPSGERWISAIERRQNMVAPEFLNEELRLRAHVRRSATGFRKQFSEARLFPGRLVQRVHKTLPLLVVENEARLIRESLFSFFAGGAEDKVGDIDPLPARHFDERFLTRSGAKLEAPVSWSFGC